MGSNDKPALVLEGGGYRGIFTAGVLDVLLESGIYTSSFKSAWGVSAGALNAVSYRSRQIGRTMRIMLTFRDDPRMMSLLSLVRTGNLAGTDFMYDEVQNHIDPCDLEVFDNDLTPMYFVASDVLFGAPAYLAVEGERLDATKARASASLPGVSTMVEIDGRRYLDGGTTDSIACAVAMGLARAPEGSGAEPADRALVVLTQDRTYIKDGATERAILRTHRYDAYPYYEQALATRADRYNAQREELAGLEAEGRALVLRPPEPVKIHTSEHNGEPLLRLYLQGRQEAASHLDEIRAFL